MTTKSPTYKAIVEYITKFSDLPQHMDTRDSPTSTLCSASTVCRRPVVKSKTDSGNVRRVYEEI